MFPSTTSWETSELARKQNCFPRDHTLSVYFLIIILGTVSCSNELDISVLMQITPQNKLYYGICANRGFCGLVRMALK